MGTKVLLGRLWVPLAQAALPLAVLSVEAALVALHGTYPDPLAATGGGDNVWYVAMARDPFSVGPGVCRAPYCWRVLTPLLVHLLPLPLDLGFWVVTLAGLGLTVFGLQALLRALGLTGQAAVAGGLAWVTLGPATGFPLFDYLLVDPLACALLSFALAWAVERRGALLILTLCLLALNKEIVVLAAVFALVWSVERRDRAMVLWSSVGAALSLAILIGLHLARPAPSPGWIEIANHLLAIFPGAQYWTIRLLAATAGTWGILLPLALGQWRRPGSLMRSKAALLFLTGATAQILISSDVERVVMYGFPVVIAGAVAQLEAWRDHSAKWVVWTSVVLVQLSWWFAYAGWGAYATTLLLNGPQFLLELCILAAALATAGSAFLTRLRHAQ